MKANRTYIKHLDTYVPKEKMYFKDHLDHFTKKDTIFKTADNFMKFAQDTIKIDSVSIERKLSLESMMTELLDKNLDEGYVLPEAIDYIILAMDFDDHLMHYGHYIQHEFDMPNANVIRVSENSCCNIDVGMGLASTLVEGSDRPIEVLILSGLKLEENLNKRIIGNYGVVGDGIGIAVLSNKKEESIMKFLAQETITKGCLYEVDYVKDNTVFHYQSYVECIQKMLDKHKIDPNSLNKVILHNANQGLMEHALVSCNINKDLIDTTNLYKYGHLGTTDLILNTHSYLQNGANEGDLVLALNLGTVGTYVATLFKK
jgi:3-oxoacyl-[acyl-carrier-protein] synthase III